MATQIIDGNKLHESLDDQKTLVVFFTHWCGPCKMLSPILEDISEKYKILKIQGDVESKAREEYKIEVFPTILLFHKRKIVKKHLGFMPKLELINWIEN